MFVIFFTGNNESEDEIDTKNKSKALLNTFSIVQVFTIIGNCNFKTTTSSSLADNGETNVLTVTLGSLTVFFMTAVVGLVVKIGHLHTGTAERWSVAHPQM